MLRRKTCYGLGAPPTRFFRGDSGTGGAAFDQPASWLVDRRQDKEARSRFVLPSRIWTSKSIRRPAARQQRPAAARSKPNPRRDLEGSWGRRPWASGFLRLLQTPSASPAAGRTDRDCEKAAAGEGVQRTASRGVVAGSRASPRTPGDGGDARDGVEPASTRWRTRREGLTSWNRHQPDPRDGQEEAA